jgi:ABC-type transporter Mla MlaB component
MNAVTGVLSQPAGRITLALKGNLYAEMLPEVSRFIENNQALEKQVHLDLSEVRLLDREAARFLAEQSRRGIELVNCPLYLTLWIPPH